MSFILIHTSILIILLGGGISVIYSDKAYIEIAKGETIDSARRDNNSILKLPFKLKLNNFIIEKYNSRPTNFLTILDSNLNELLSYEFDKNTKFKIPGSRYSVEIVRIVPDLMIKGNRKIVSKSEKWLNPAIKIKVDDEEGWLFANFEEYKINKFKNYYFIYDIEEHHDEIKSFKSNLSIIKGNTSVLNKTIEVNKPLNVDGFSIYQFSYDKNNANWSGLQIKKDPGVPVVMLGYVLLLLGLVYYLIQKHNLESNNNTGEM